MRKSLTFTKQPIMAYTTTTNTSYGQRLGASFKGILGGVVMFIIGTILLFWNEGNFVKTKKAIEEAQGAAVSVSDVSQVDPALNGKLIHATAKADTQEVLTDELFGVSGVAIALKRSVEYYQFTEQSSTKTKEKIGGGKEEVTTYTYRKDWVGGPVDSGSFKDPEYQSSNKVLTRVEAKSQRASEVSFGAYRLPGFLISRISGDVPAQINLTDEQKAEWNKQLTSGTAAGEETTESISMIHVQSGNIVYLGKDPNNPQVGDVRVTLSKVMPGEVSIIAKVVGSTFEEFIASNGKSISYLKMGTVSAANMFESAHSANSTWTWILRIVGVLLVVFGLKSIFGIITTLAKVVPFVASIVGAGIGLVCWVLGGAWSLLIIALAWVTYRPMVGIPLLVIAVAGIVYLKMAASKKKALN